MAIALVKWWNYDNELTVLNLWADKPVCHVAVMLRVATFFELHCSSWRLGETAPLQSSSATGRQRSGHK